MGAELHPRRELERLARGVATREEARAAARHLLSGCRTCSEWLNERLISGASTVGDIAAVLDRAEAGAVGLHALVESQAEQARALVEDLDSMPPERRRLVVMNSARVGSPAVVYRLVDRSRTLRHESASGTVHYAELAVAAAERTAGPGAGGARAVAWAELGNARRIASDLAGAEAALSRAEEIADENGADPHFEAELLSLRGSLATDQRQFASAERLVYRAAKRFARCGDAPGAAKALLQLAHVRERRGEPAHAIRPAREAVDLARAAGDRRLELIGLQNLVHLISEAGEADQAAQLLPRLRRLFYREAPSLDRLRFEWLAARIEARAGRAGRAAAALDELRESYAAQGMLYEAALVSLDLFAALIDLDQRRDLARIAREAAHLFRSLRVDREALMSLSLLAQTQRHETGEILTRLAAALEAARTSDRSPAPPGSRTG